MVAPDPTNQVTTDDPFEGRWLVNGTDPFGLEYGGTLTITVADDGYELGWIITGAIFEGRARRVGDTLSGTWSRDVDGTSIEGDLEYRRDGDLIDGTLTGPGGDIGTESGERAR